MYKFIGLYFDLFNVIILIIGILKEIFVLLLFKNIIVIVILWFINFVIFVKKKGNEVVRNVWFIENLVYVDICRLFSWLFFRCL